MQKVIFYALDHQEKFDVPFPRQDFDESKNIYRINLVLKKNITKVEKWCEERTGDKLAESQIRYILYRFFLHKIEYKEINEYIRLNRKKFYGAKS